MEPKYMGKASLWYQCAVCGESVCHVKGPHYLDNGTILYCPECGGGTTVVLSTADHRDSERVIDYAQQIIDINDWLCEHEPNAYWSENDTATVVLSVLERKDKELEELRRKVAIS